MSRLFEKNVEKLLTYCTCSDIIINCITIACIMAGFLQMNGKNRLYSVGISPSAEILQAVEKYKFHQSKGKLKLELE